MSKTKETPLSAEGVPLKAQDDAAEAQDDASVDAVLELSELQHHGDMGEERRLTEDEAEQAGDIIGSALAPARPTDRLQDGLAFENARRDEAVAQGVEATTQERLWELARQEEAQGQGVSDIGQTTQKRLFRESRIEEAAAEKLEEARHGPVEPITITPHGVDQVARDEDLAAEAPQIRADAAAKVREERGDTPAKKSRGKSSRKTASSRRKKASTATAADGSQVVSP